MARYLITGGTGLAGHHIVRELVAMGVDSDEIVVYDAFPKLANIEDVRDHLTLVKGDITDLPQLFGAFQNYEPEYVIHLASCSARQSWLNPNEAIRVTVQGANNVFEAMRFFGAKSCVYAVTSGVYGRPEAFYWKERPVMLTEDDPIATHNPYGATKYVTEAMAYTYAEKYDLRLLGVRLAGLWGLGEGQRHGPADLHAFIRDVGLERRARIPAFWTVFDSICLSYAKDVARQFIQLCELATGELPRRIYNQGSKDPYTLEDICDILTSLVPGAKIDSASLDEKEEWVDSVVPPGIDATRWYEELGMEEEWPLEAAVRDVINHYRADAKLDLV